MRVPPHVVHSGAYHPHRCGTLLVFLRSQHPSEGVQDTNSITLCLYCGALKWVYWFPFSECNTARRKDSRLEDRTAAVNCQNIEFRVQNSVIQLLGSTCIWDQSSMTSRCSVRSLPCSDGVRRAAWERVEILHLHSLYSRLYSPLQVSASESIIMARNKKKKVKRELTEEEKKAKVELKAIKAEEKRKKRILIKRDKLMNNMSIESTISKNNMYKVHMQWRELMSQGKIEELRASVVPMMEKYENDINKANKTIKYLWNRLEEADDQYEFSHNNHMQTMNILIDLHHTRTQIMEHDFIKQLRRLESEFNTEREYIINMHKRNEKELTDMMKAMEIEFKEIMNEQRQQFEVIREELKNKSTEEYNVAKLGLEAQVEDLENQIQKTHKGYLANTEAKTIQFKTMVKKDIMTSRLVEQRMRKLIRLHEALAYWRARIAVNTHEWEAMNKALKEEKDRINKHYQDLKRSLNRMHVSEHAKLRAISRASGEVMTNLTKKLKLAEGILTLGALNKKLETEYDKIYPSLVYNEGNNYPLKQNVPQVSQNEKPLLDDLFDKSHLERTLRFTSYALDEYGTEVVEERYFENLNRRFNKVMLEKMAINLERKRLKEVNYHLQKQLENYLEMSPMIKHKLKASKLMIDFGEEISSKRCH